MYNFTIKLIGGVINGKVLPGKIHKKSNQSR